MSFEGVTVIEQQLSGHTLQQSSVSRVSRISTDESWPRDRDAAGVSDFCPAVRVERGHAQQPLTHLSGRNRHLQLTAGRRQTAASRATGINKRQNIQIINLRQAAFKNADDIPDTAAGGEQF